LRLKILQQYIYNSNHCNTMLFRLVQICAWLGGRQLHSWCRCVLGNLYRLCRKPNSSSTVGSVGRVSDSITPPVFTSPPQT
jgi:hypothetical protein